MGISVISEPTLGIDVAETHTVAQFQVGKHIQAANGTWYRYVQANGAKTAFLLYHFDELFQLEAAVTTTIAAAAPLYLAVPQIAMADDAFGWVAVGGPMTISALTLCATDVELYTTATAGSVDDTVGSNGLIQGLKLNSTVGGVTANTPAMAGVSQIQIVNL